VLDLLLPQRCLVCGAGGTQLCPDCTARLPRLTPPLCERCGAPTAWPVKRCRECAGRRIAFETARAAVAYEAGAVRLVAAWKEHGLRGLADDAAALVAERLPRPVADTVTFVPADPERRLVRGYHPPQRLAEALGRHWEVPYEQILSRAEPSRRQRGLPLAERRRNGRRAFTSAAANGTVVWSTTCIRAAPANAAAAALARGSAASRSWPSPARFGLRE
jgi:predicted amidophosphoribosyltransferase